MLPEIEFRIARFLEIPLAIVTNPTQPLIVPQYNLARMRRIHNVESDKLAPAIHTSLRIAAAVVRNLKEPLPPFDLPTNPSNLRKEILTKASVVSFEELLDLTWKSGIPVIPLKTLPSPNFQGLACMIGDRPVIILGHKIDMPGRVAFIIAHEIGHIVYGHCKKGIIVVDEEDGQDDTHEEHEADEYAKKLFTGDNTVPDIGNGDFKSLAERAYRIEQELGISAGYTLFTWAARTRDYTRATMAAKALYINGGARLLTKNVFRKYVQIEGVSETDSALLSCIGFDKEPE